MMTASISQKKASTFRMECRVSINIHATPEKLWLLLTNAADFPALELDGYVYQGFDRPG